MDIKRGNAIILSLDSFNEGSKLTKRLMGDDYITLPFTLAEPISFAIGDYVDIVLGGEQTVFGRYELVSAYKPTYNTNTGCYDYQLRLDAYYFQWKNRQMKYNPQTGGNELSFSLTSSIGTHAAILLQNLVANGFFFYDNAHTPFTVDYDETVDINKAKLVQYDNISILDALTSIAKTFECEWWVTDSVIHFGKCQKGDSVQEVIFEIGSNVSEMSKSDNGATFATRLYCFGSDRNLPKTYKKSVSEDLTKSAVVQRRLMLPTNAELTQESAELIDGKYILSDNGYLQVAGVSDDKVVEGVFVDDDIYPKTDCFVSDVRTYTDTREKDGEVITQTFYRLIDGSGFNFNTDMLLEDATLHIIFTSGSMNGMDFECHYDDDEHYYEVVVNESYGRSLPDTNLHPEKGDHFAVYNWDASKLEESNLIPKASNELLASAIKKFEKAKIDPAQYTCTEDCFEESYIIRELGDKIRLVNPAYFENGRSSRITGIEINLDLPYDHPKYIVSEKADYIYQSHVEKTEELTFNGQSYQGKNVGGDGVYLIKTNDTARPSDSNAYSAKRALEEFLSAKEDDTAQGLVGFVKGLWVKTKGLFGFSEQGDVTARSLKTTGSSGGTTPDADNVTQKNLGLEVSESGVIGGILRVAKSLLTKTIQSLNFSGSDSLTGTGWQLTDDDGNGRSRLIVDDAVFRGKVTLNELGVRKLTAMGGNYVFSPAASIIEAVDYYDYKIVPGEVEPTVELLGYEYIKVPWVLRLIPLSLRGRYLSRKKWVRSTMKAEDYARVKYYRCWLKADDGSTQTINTWQVGMLARCQTFDTSQIENGTHGGDYDKPRDSGGTYSDVTNKLYWRAVVGKGEGIDKEHYQGETIALDDGRKHNYIDLANYEDNNGVKLFFNGSDHVNAGDHIVCFGDWKDRQLANLVTIETIGSDAPAVKEFVGVGYTDGTSIDWKFENKMRTRVSPTAGNRFIAPEFIIETDGEFIRYDECVGFDTPSNPKDGDVMLLSYDDISNDYQVEVWDAATSTWNDEHCAVGERYYCTTNGHVYEATATGWKDLGIQLGQSVSSLKVGMDGITAQVSDLSGNLSTLSQTVGGIETRVQNAEGNITTLNQTATGLTAEVTSIKQGKNLLSGVLTAQGWKDDTNADAACDAANVSIKTAGEGATALITPQVTLPKGSKYTLSFDVAGGDVTVQWSDGTAIGTATGTERKTLVIDLTQAAADVMGNIKIFVTELSYPMLEIGEVATEFVADSEETSAFVNLTSDRIQLAVQSALGLTGIDITNGTIELRGNKVVFTDSTGTITGKISIDPTTGTLIASDVQVSGKMTATSGAIAGFTIEGGVLKGSSQSMSNYSLELGPEMMEFEKNDNLTGYTVTTTLNSDGLEIWDGKHRFKTFEAAGANSILTAAGYPDMYNTRLPLTLANTDTNSNKTNVTLRLSAHSGGKNVAAMIDNGQVMGLRPEVRGVNRDTALTLYDHTIIATNGCTLTLPSSPQEGQQYHIVCMTTGTVKLKSVAQSAEQSAAQINWKYLGSSSSYDWQLGKGPVYDLTASVREAWLTFTGTEWHLTHN